MLSCLRGYNVCIFTYGQTGTGKTYSMEVGSRGPSGVSGTRSCDGSPHDSLSCLQGPPEDPGIAPRALQSLFREMGGRGAHRVTLSMVEIYNEAVRSVPNPPLSQGSSGCRHPQPSRSASHQGPPSPRTSRAPGGAPGSSRPGGDPGGWPHLLGCAQSGDTAPGKAAVGCR